MKMSKAANTMIRHIALLSVGGVVSPDKKNLSPENIADKTWELYQQPRGKWQREVEINE